MPLRIGKFPPRAEALSEEYCPPTLLGSLLYSQIGCDSQDLSQTNDNNLSRIVTKQPSQLNSILLNE